MQWDVLSDEFNILCDLLCHNENSNILMLSEEYDYLITGNLDPDVSSQSILNNDSNERAHHEMQIQNLQVLSKITDHKL